MWEAWVKMVCRWSPVTCCLHSLLYGRNRACQDHNLVALTTHPRRGVAAKSEVSFHYAWPPSTARCDNADMRRFPPQLRVIAILAAAVGHCGCQTGTVDSIASSHVQAN